MTWANELKRNPLLNEVFTALKAGYFDKMTKVKKSEGYESQLKDIHESMQNLIRLEAYIDKCIAQGRVLQKRSPKTTGEFE